jgi:hypothetical protein
MSHTATDTPDPHSEQTEEALAYLRHVIGNDLPDMTPEFARHAAETLARISRSFC